MPYESRKFCTNGKVLYRSFREDLPVPPPGTKQFLLAHLRYSEVPKRQEGEHPNANTYRENRGWDPFGCEELGNIAEGPNWDPTHGTKLTLKKKTSLSSHSGHLSTRSINCGCSCRRYVVASGKNSWRLNSAGFFGTNHVTLQNV